MDPVLRLKHHHLTVLTEEALRVDPVEACGLLFGKKTPATIHVKRVVVSQNQLDSATRFEIDPENVVAAFSEADKEGLDFVGLFHSHPASATPSPIDLKSMKLWGDAVWLILSSTDGGVAAYQMKNGKVIEIRIRVE